MEGFSLLRSACFRYSHSQSVLIGHQLSGYARMFFLPEIDCSSMKNLPPKFTHKASDMRHSTLNLYSKQSVYKFANKIN